MTSQVRSLLPWAWLPPAGSFLAIGLAAFSLSCVPQKVKTVAAPEFNPDSIQTIAVLPFFALATPQKPNVAPLSSLAPTNEVRTQFELPPPEGTGSSKSPDTPIKVPPYAAQRLTNMVYGALQSRRNLRVLPRERVSGLIPQPTSTDPLAEARKRLLQIGARLGADAVLIGLVRTYRERAGTKIAATPAAVGFEMQLVNPADGRILWVGEYYEEQKPLNEDLMGFFERGTLAFVTADELAEIGVRKLLKQLPIGV